MIIYLATPCSRRKNRRSGGGGWMALGLFEDVLRVILNWKGKWWAHSFWVPVHPVSGRKMEWSWKSGVDIDMQILCGEHPPWQKRRWSGRVGAWNRHEGCYGSSDRRWSHRINGRDGWMNGWILKWNNWIGILQWPDPLTSQCIITGRLTNLLFTKKTSIYN